MAGNDVRRNQRPIWAALTALLLMGMITSLFLAARAKQSAEATAVARAQVAVQDDLAPLLTPSDVTQPVTGARYQTLSALVTRRLLSAGPSDGVTLFSGDATVLFDVERGMVGKRQPELRPRIERVLNEGRESVVEGDTFHAFVPLRLRPEEGAVAVADVTQPYEPLWIAASKPWRLAAIGFAAMLLPALGLLLLSFRGLFRRASGRRPAWTAVPISASAPERPVRPARIAGASAPAVYEHPGYRAEVEARRVAEEHAARAEDAAEGLRRELKQLKQAAERPEVAQPAGSQRRLVEAEERTRASERERTQLADKLRRTEMQRAELFERLDHALEEIADVKQQQAAASASVADPELELKVAASEERAGAAEDRASAAESRAATAERRAAATDDTIRAMEARAQEAEKASRAADQLATSSEAGRRSAERMAEAARAEAASLELRLAQAEDLATTSGQRIAEAESIAAAAQATRDEAVLTVEERVAAAEQRAEEARAQSLADAEALASVEALARTAEERATAAEERAEEAQRDTARAGERADAIESDALRATDHAARMELSVANANDQLSQTTDRLEQTQAELTQALSQLDLARQQSVTATENLSTLEQQMGTASKREEESAERVRRAEELAAASARRADEAQELLRAEEERRADAETGEPSGEDQPELAEVLRITKERLHRSGERLQATEDRARAAEHELDSGRERIEELEGIIRREKLHEALQHLRGDEQPAAAPPLEERRAAAPFMKALSLDARNSVAAIQGLVLAMKHSEKPDDRPPMLRKLNAHARKLDRLVGDLLDADRLARGEMELKVRRTDIQALARRVLDECALDGDRAVRVESEKVVVAVDPIRVEGILVALLNNSVDRSRPRHEITVRIAQQDGGALISVEDDEPSSDASMSPVVSRFADVHGGWAAVESRAGGGSAFRVFLPDHDAETVRTTIAPEQDTIEIRDGAATDVAADAQ